MRNGLDTEVLVMGTSHAYWGVNPNFFSMKTLNLAYNNRPFSQDLEIAEQFIDKLPDLKFILLPADYFTLYFKGSDKFNKLNSVHFKLNETGFIDNYRHLKWCKFNCSKSPNEIELLGYSHHNDSLSTLSHKEKEELGLKRVSAWNNEWLIPQTYETTLNSNKTALNAFLINSEANDIQVVFVKYPVSKFVESGYIDTVLDGSLFQYALERDLMVVDCGEYSFIESEFHDVDHLNYIGAQRLSRILDSIILVKKTTNISADGF
jgi:hypothetical protein